MLDRHLSVYARVVLFLALVCLALIGLDLKQSWTSHDNRLREARLETSNLARSLAQHAQDVFETTDSALKGLRDTVEADGLGPAAVGRLGQRMRSRVVNQRLFHRVFMLDEAGNVITTSATGSLSQELHNLNYAERDFFRYHRDHNEDVALIGPPIKGKFDGVWVVTLSRRINHPDGRFAAVVGASISIDLFQRFFETFEIGERGIMLLGSAQGTLMVRRPFNEKNIGISLGNSSFFPKLEDSLRSGSAEFTSVLERRPQIGSFHRVDGFALTTVVAFDKNEVLTTWRHEMKMHVWWLVGTMIFVALLGHRLTNQIRDRVAAEGIAQKLQLEADERRRTEEERKAYQRELEQQKRELERSNADLEQFAYAASHDLQSPLRAIAHLARWVEEDVGATASRETIDNLGLLSGRVVRLQMLISGLLAYARLGRGEMVAEDVDVAACVADIVSLLDPAPGFTVTCEGVMGIIRTFRTPFELVLKNLVSNALQHHDRDEGRVGVSMRLLDRIAEIRVSDDGPGIEERFHEAIFVIFKTLQPRDEFESAGIGLAMVKKQVTENGGRIWVESSRPARGSTFVFTWRLADE